MIKEKPLWLGMMKQFFTTFTLWDFVVHRSKILMKLWSIVSRNVFHGLTTWYPLVAMLSILALFLNQWVMDMKQRITKNWTAVLAPTRI